MGDRDSGLRESIAELFRAGLVAAEPGQAVDRHLEVDADGLPVLAGERLERCGRLRVVAVGKAATAMAEAALARLAPELAVETLVVVDRGNARPVAGGRVFATGHPVPDAAGVEAAAEVRALLAPLDAGDAVLVLISGGGSALLPAPAAWVTLDDKILLTEQLLRSGADIGELNTVRKHLSYLKGGGLVRVAAPARVEALILSDVVGDDLSVVASGPTVADPTSFADALAVLDRYRHGSQAPPRARARLERGIGGEVPETVKPGDPLLARVANVLIGGNARSLEAVAAAARRLGYAVEIAERRLIGEARRAAERLAAYLERVPADKTLAVLAGGETTVTVTGDGLGGRNQELALAFALLAERPRRPPSWVLLSAGTDGRDGPTEAAGGVVDGGTLERGRAAGRDPVADLENNDSNRFLAAAGDLLITGATGTNVADLQILLLAPAAG